MNRIEPLKHFPEYNSSQEPIHYSFMRRDELGSDEVGRNSAPDCKCHTLHGDPHRSSVPACQRASVSACQPAIRRVYQCQ